MRRSLLAVLAFTTGAALPLAAQSNHAPLRPSGFTVGAEATVAQPVGAFADVVGAAGVLSLRAEGNFLIYGHERRGDICAAGTCRVRFNLDTNNQIASGFIGPQLEVPSGPVRPYVRAGAGFAYFFTISSLSGTGSDAFASSENYHDGVFAWTGGGGLRLPFAISRVPVAIDLGARYQRNGEASYLRKGTGITDNPDGTVRINPTRTDANFVLWHLGMAVTIPHSRSHG
jgi:hypothetical protein